ncbi:hypothetical protein MTO96_008128 [Rhipicephalus appendiculatus]
MASETQTTFPTAGWEQDLGNLPRLQHERIVEFYKEKAETRRCLDRSYNFFVECYVDPASIKVNYTNKIEAVNWRAVREGGLDSPLSVRFYDPRGVSRTLDEQKAAERQLAEEILKEDLDSEFAKGLLEDDNHPYERTKWGLASVLAPLSYQQPLLPFGFDVVKTINSA